MVLWQTSVPRNIIRYGIKKVQYHLIDLKNDQGILLKEWKS